MLESMVNPCEEGSICIHKQIHTHARTPSQHAHTCALVGLPSHLAQPFDRPHVTSLWPTAALDGGPQQH